MFRYFHLLAPVLGDDSVYADVDSSAADATFQPFMDTDTDMCRFKLSNQFVSSQLYTCYCADTVVEVVFRCFT